MGSPTHIDPTRAATPHARSPLIRLTVLLALTIGGLSFADRFLANLESSELAGGARRDYENGMRLLKAGKPAAAIDALRDAHAESRDNMTYQLAEIDAMAHAGQPADAAPLMDDLLQRFPNDGSVNLTAARLAAGKGDEDGAEAYYHRAIFGQWGGKDAAASRTAARLELIDFLAAKGRMQPLLAELISIDAESPSDHAVQAKIARLFLTAGSPERSARAWQSYLNSHRKDAMAWAGLGEAELQAGDYQRARSAFRQAMAIDPQDANVKSQFALVDLVTDLDPTPHQLGAAEKYARAVRILDMANADLSRCDPSAPSVESGKMDAEQVLSAAQQTWQLRVKTCAGISKDEDALRLIMSKLSSQ